MNQIIQRKIKAIDRIFSLKNPTQQDREDFFKLENDLIKSLGKYKYECEVFGKQFAECDMSDLEITEVQNVKTKTY